MASEFRGKQMQRITLIANDDRVSGVVSALVANDVINPTSEEVCGFTFALVAPLGTDKHNCGHVSWLLGLRS